MLSWIGIAAVSIALMAPPATAAADVPCVGSWLCNVENSGESVDLSAGGSSTGDAGGWDTPPESRAGPVDEQAPPPPPERCNSLNPCSDYEIWTPPDLTVEDIASFRPSVPSLGGEPAGFGVAGLPTNLVAEASEQIIPGTLLDLPVRVRFVPAGFVFDHGDGTSARTRNGGASWAALGQTQFSPTATSHVYTARGSYTVTASAQFAAFVDWGSGTWRPVTGTVTSSAGAYPLRIVEASTALVDRTCLEDPNGPGC